ncbi:hypothetical protein TTHERM_001478590 (macronuclear) [Tetrahymena thermophila SB210]|uniref:Uncharacterized protein n=1 Tax=Tetrahymena thermophila (strain SB210) TaxID=312017 RepID=W7XLD4_TETTS|nr:hypothetical protein TTHERM_001478590 [Tetrahymena thermophila SB210]EWS76094.1 hypothetical protein TTHERM_001478590 [Tetrahymena thermophila SB210]|eukprot:XP_012651372.1 hypothetical protein TTHERM_001478590 [Tetrahymena thermophila SB210]
MMETQIFLIICRNYLTKQNYLINILKIFLLKLQKKRQNFDINKIFLALFYQNRNLSIILTNKFGYFQDKPNLNHHQKNKQTNKSLISKQQMVLLKLKKKKIIQQ